MYCCSLVPDVPDALIGQQMFRPPWLANLNTLAATPSLGLRTEACWDWVEAPLPFFRCSCCDVEEVVCVFRCIHANLICIASQWVAFLYWHFKTRWRWCHIYLCKTLTCTPVSSLQQTALIPAVGFIYIMSTVSSDSWFLWDDDLCGLLLMFIFMFYYFADFFSQ